MMKRSVIVAYTDDGHWQAEAVTAEGVRELNRRETLHFLYSYLKYGRGLFIKRLSSVLIRALTFRLKPSQLPSEK